MVDSVLGWFVFLVIFIVVVVFMIWFVWGFEFRMVYGFIVVVLVLIIVCFCVLGLVMLMLIMVGVGKGVQVGVLIRNVEVFECFEKVDMLVVDKIGMFMEGLFMVIGIISFNLGGEIFFLCVIVVVEKGL